MTQYFSNKNLKIVYDQTEQNVTLSTPINCGGSKCVYNLNDDCVLVLPNYRMSDYIDSFLKNWSDFSIREVKISDHLISIGLLTPRHYLVEVKSNNKTFNSYISKSFNAFEKKGYRIYDVKVRMNPINLLVDKNINIGIPVTWIPILYPLIEDIVKMAKYNVSYNRDMINFIYLPNENSIWKYKMRLFLFDYPRDFKINKHIDDINYSKYFSVLTTAIEEITYQIYDQKTNRKNPMLSDEYSNIMKETISFFRDYLEEF